MLRCLNEAGRRQKLEPVRVFGLLHLKLCWAQACVLERDGDLMKQGVCTGSSCIRVFGPAAPQTVLVSGVRVI